MEGKRRKEISPLPPPDRNPSRFLSPPHIIHPIFFLPSLSFFLLQTEIPYVLSHHWDALGNERSAFEKYFFLFVSSFFFSIIHKDTFRKPIEKRRRKETFILQTVHSTFRLSFPFFFHSLSFLRINKESKRRKKNWRRARNSSDTLHTSFFILQIEIFLFPDSVSVFFVFLILILFPFFMS